MIEGNSLSLNIVKEEGDPPIKNEADFIASGICTRRRFTYSAAPVLPAHRGWPERFMEKRDLYIIKYLAKRVDDLKRGDLWDHIRGNWAFEGDRLSRAISFLGSTLESEERRGPAKRSSHAHQIIGTWWFF